MQIHNVAQRTPEWDELRGRCWTASVAPAMTGMSPYMRRDEAIQHAATGSEREFSDWVVKNVLEKGHEVEAKGRAMAEVMIGEDLYPVTATESIEGLSRPLLASLDGMTMAGDTTFECKQFSQELFEAVQAGSCLYWRPQVAQGLLITAADKCLFMVTDGTPEKTATCWITITEGEGRDLIAGWRQFEQDVRDYVPMEPEVVIVGRAPKELPVLAVQVEGRVLASNLDAFRDIALERIRSINRNPKTDEDFADAEKTIKWLKDGEERLELEKKRVLAQTSTIDDFFRAVDEVREEMRETRLALDRATTNNRQSVRAEIVMDGSLLLVGHLHALNNQLAEVAKGWWPSGIAMPTVTADSVAANFPGAAKGLKTLASVRDKVNVELARCKIKANEIGQRIEANLIALIGTAPAHAYLFTDAALLVMKPPADLLLIIADRLKADAERALQHDAAAAMQKVIEKAANGGTAPPTAQIGLPGVAAVPIKIAIEPFGTNHVHMQVVVEEPGHYELTIERKTCRVTEIRRFK